MEIICVSGAASPEEAGLQEISVWHKSSPSTRRSGILRTSISEQDRKEIEWYWTEYVMSEPLDEDRAHQAARLLYHLGDNLWAGIVDTVRDVLESHRVRSLDSSLQILRLEIYGDGCNKSLHQFPWETLENEPRSMSHTGEKVKLAVSRIMDAGSGSRSIPQFAYPLKQARLHILFVAARPSRDTDIAHRAISRDLSSLFGEFPDDVWFTFSRPGTWEALVAMLSNYEPSYFDIVHFDMHGSLVDDKKGRKRACLEFASSNYHRASSKRPSRKDARQIAELMQKYGIPAVVLNACDSAHVSQSSDTNLAAGLVECGLQNVVAMSHKVSAATAIAFMLHFYKDIIRTRDWTQGVHCGREGLKANCRRLGRWGTIVDCHDSGNPVHYSASNAELGSATSQTANTSPRQVDPTTNVLADDILVGQLLQRSKSYSIDTSSCRDLDILSLEELLHNRPVLIVAGESGSGKTTFARYLETEWQRTKHASRVTYTKVSDTCSDWYSELFQQLKEEADSSEQLGRDNHSGAKYEHVHLVDGLYFPLCAGSCKPLTQNVVGHAEILQVMKLCKLSKRYRLLIFTATMLEQFEMEDVMLPHYKLALPDSVELGQMIAHYSQPAKAVEQRSLVASIDKVDLEEYFSLTGSNPAFCEFSLQAMSQVHSDTENVWGGGTWHFDALSPSAISATTFPLHTTTYLSDFRNGLAALEEENYQEYLIILRLFIFERKTPTNMSQWMPFAAADPPSTEYILDGPTMLLLPQFKSPEAKKSWDAIWERCCQMLCAFGVAQKNRSSTAEGQNGLILHPLLSVIVCRELQRHDNFTIMLEAYQRFLWAFYERSMCDLILAIEAGQMTHAQVLQCMSCDEENLQSAIRFATLQPEFTNRTMNTIHLTVSILKPGLISRLRLRRWVAVFRVVLKSYEQVNLNENGWSDLPDTFRARYFAEAMLIAQFLCDMVGALEDAQSACEVARVALALADKFGFAEGSSTLADTWIFSARCYIIEHNISQQMMNSSATMLRANFDHNANHGNMPGGPYIARFAERAVFTAKLRLAARWNLEIDSIPLGHTLLDALTEFSSQAQAFFVEERDMQNLYPNALRQWMARRLAECLGCDHKSFLPTRTEDNTLFKTQMLSWIDRELSLETLRQNGHGDNRMHLEKALDDAFRLGELEVQEEVVSQLFRRACQNGNLVEATNWYVQLEQVGAELFKTGKWTTAQCEIAKANHLNYIGLALQFPDYINSTRRAPEDDGNTLLAVAYALRARQVLLDVDQKQAQKALINANSLVTVLGFGTLPLLSRGIPDNDILSLRDWLTSMLENVQFKWKNDAVCVPWFDGERPLIYFSIVYHGWRSSPHPSETKPEVNTLDRDAWEGALALTLSSSREDVRKFMEVLHKTLRDVPVPYTISEGISLNLEPHQKQMLETSLAILVGASDRIGLLAEST